MKTKINLEDKENLFKGKFQIQISDEPKSGLIRVIDYFSPIIQERYKVLNHDGDMHYFNAAGEHLTQFTDKVQQVKDGKVIPWKVDNNYKVYKRDIRTGKPITEGDESVIKAPAYDYFTDMIFNNPISMKSILIEAIKFDDENGLFDI
ncbi:hypothetical protein [Ornithobacterium rhinotracheale]